MRYLEYRKARIEIVPMIDIMLFLLVFFIMVVVKMVPATGIGAHLPHSSTAEQLPHPKAMISVFEDGRIVLGSEEVSLAVLTDRLAANNPADTAVTIASADKVTVQQVMAVMDACRNAGVTQLGMAALQKRP